MTLEIASFFIGSSTGAAGFWIMYEALNYIRKHSTCSAKGRIDLGASPSLQRDRVVSLRRMASV